MKEFKLETILVPVDFSDTSNKALQYAIELSKLTQARLVLVHVVEITGVTVPYEVITLGVITEQMMDESKFKLKTLSEEIRKEHNLSVKQISTSGNVYENIIRAAHLQDADLIIMGTHGASGIKEWLLGSNAYRVVHNTNIPVLTINLHTDTTHFKKIVFPFNENEVTFLKVKQVATMARVFDATILLFGYTEEQTIEAKKSLRTKGEKLVLEFSKENISCSFAMTLGEDYAEEIMHFAVKENADLISIVCNKSDTADKIFQTKPEKKLVNHSIIPVLNVPVD